MRTVYAIAMHVLGNAEENVLLTLCSLPVQRSRAAEFAARASTWEPARDRWLELRARIESALATLSSGDLDRECTHPRRGKLSGREVLLVVARHAAEHWGEAQLTLNLLRARPLASLERAS